MTAADSRPSGAGFGYWAPTLLIFKILALDSILIFGIARFRRRDGEPMQYFVVMIDYGRRGREAVVDPEITRREVISRVGFRRVQERQLHPRNSGLRGRRCHRRDSGRSRPSRNPGDRPPTCRPTVSIIVAISGSMRRYDDGAFPQPVSTFFRIVK